MKYLICTIAVITALVAGLPAQEAEVYPQSGHRSDVSSVVFSPDGSQVLSGSYDRTVKLWDAATGRVIRTYTGHTGLVTSVAFSPDGRQILSGSGDRTVKLWDTVTGEVIRTFTGHTTGEWVKSVAFSPDGRQILSGGSYTKLWDIATGREIRTFDEGWRYSVNSVAFSPDGRFILSSLDDTPTKSGERVGDENMILRDAATGDVIRTFTGHTVGINFVSVAFSPDGKQIISGTECSYPFPFFPSDTNSSLILWDVTTGEEIRTFTGHTDGVTAVAFSPDGKCIISGSRDSTVKLWDVATGEEIITFTGEIYRVNSFSFSPDGRQVLSCSWGDKTIKLWDTATGREIRTFH
jgi:WD40 repeat protein